MDGRRSVTDSRLNFDSDDFSSRLSHSAPTRISEPQPQAWSRTGLGCVDGAGRPMRSFRIL